MFPFSPLVLSDYLGQFVSNMAELVHVLTLDLFTLLTVYLPGQYSGWEGVLGSYIVLSPFKEYLESVSIIGILLGAFSSFFVAYTLFKWLLSKK